MRPQVGLLILALAGTSCATPPIELTPVFPTGQQRVYALSATATITIELPEGTTTERTRLQARSTIDVLSSDAEGARLRLTLEPLSFIRDGTDERRDPQQVELSVGPDGTVLAVETVHGVAADLSGGVEDLAPLLGTALPQQRLRLGERWRRSLPAPAGQPGPIEQTGRIAALRSVTGLDSVVVRLGTTRPLRRARTVGERTVALEGTEFSTSTIAFALRERFPVRIQADAEGRFFLDGAPDAGTVTIRTASVLDLESAGPRGG